MTRTAKRSTAIFLAFALLLPMAAPAFAQELQTDYVAFGDSVAAGVRGGTGEASSALGYTDLLASDLKADGHSGSFNKDFCVSGATSKSLAADTAVLTDKSTERAKLVANAELATVQIGANDLLAPFTSYVKEAGGTANMDAAKAKAALKQVADSVPTTAPAVQANIETILKDILAANPNVKIFVLGYYDPLPTVSKLLGVDLKAPMQSFNGYIEKAVTNVDAAVSSAQVHYVDLSDTIAADAANDLVTTDIHPTEAGYKAIAETLWAHVKVFLPTTDTDSAEPVSVVPANATVLVNGKQVAFGAYGIEGNNYFKLRDLAYALTGSAGQFNVWANGTGPSLTVMLSQNTAYVPVGGEMTNSGAVATVAYRHVPKAQLGDSALTLTTYAINDYNYVKLRDVGAALDFGVSWNGDTKTVSIDTSKHYAA